MGDIRTVRSTKRNYRLTKGGTVRMSKINRDANKFMTEFKETPQAVLGVYGTEEWVEANIIQKRHAQQLKTVYTSCSWLTDAAFDLNEFAENNFSRYTFFAPDHLVGYVEPDTLIKIEYSRKKIRVCMIGDKSVSDKWATVFNEKFLKAESLIEWVYNKNGDTITVPLNYRPSIRAAYPWIDKDTFPTIDSYIDSYLDSEASVIILIGPPGTGKTTFIKNLIHRSKANAKVTYDPQLLCDDGFFAGFIDDDTQFLVMEDADEFLKSRSDGNTMMHKFLNVSDGLISAADKKMIFSTNLPDVKEIDEALMRPGRCFDIVKFRNLTRDEATAVLKEIDSDKPLPDENSFTLAEIFQKLPSNTKLTKKKMGFL